MHRRTADNWRVDEQLKSQRIAKQFTNSHPQISNT
jgi:hypothetical protein